jgi:6-phosphogluconolactonase
VDARGPSRREFVAASAIGVLGLVTASRSSSGSAEPEAEVEPLYVGTYTEASRDEGIFVLHFDARTGALRQTGAVHAGANPSFLAIHPNGRALYAVNEVTERDGKPTGTVSAFAVAPESGALTRLNERPAEGGDPCYLSVDGSGRVVLVANYVGGNVALLPIQNDGALGPARHVVQHRGSGPNTARQDSAHAHYIAPDPSNRFALAADLGMDRVLAYRLDVEGGTLRHVDGDARMRPGAGPRHLAFHPRLPLVYVANELDSTVSTLRFDRESGVLSVLGSRPTVPVDWRGTNYPAHIHIAPSGRTLYVSNRGHNSIAVFSVADATGALALEQTIPTEGDWPRNFTLDPSGRWLLAANQRSNSVVVFRRDPADGRLTLTSQRIAVAAPACLCFRTAATGA